MKYLLTFFILAQHGTLPRTYTPEEKCSSECHQKHCDEWVACYSQPDPQRCQLGVTQTELECVKKCEVPKT